MRRMRRLLLGMVAVLAGGWLAAAEPTALPAGFVEGMRRALDADGAWTMEKTVPALKRPLKSSGLVSCFRGKGFIWVTERPFRHEIRITPEAMTFASVGNRSERKAADLPYYEEICALTDRFAAGERGALADFFDEVEGSALEGGRWRVRLVPVRQARRLFAEVELTGGETLDSAVLRAPDGTVISLVFRELGRATHRLWQEQADGTP